MSQESLAEVTSDSTKEVPRLRGLQHTNHEEVMNENAPPEREPVYYTIPRDEWAYNEGIQNAAVRTKQQLDARLNGCGSSSGSGYVTTVTKEKISDHHKRREVVIKHITLEDDKPDVGVEELKSKAPNTVDGQAKGAKDSEVVEDVPVSVETEDFQYQGSCTENYYNSDYDPIPAGAQIDGHAIGTTGTPAYHSGRGEFVMLTVNHILDDGNDEQNQQDAFQPCALNTYSNQGPFLKGKTEPDGLEPNNLCDRNDELRMDAASLSFDTDVSYKFAADSGSYKSAEIYEVLGWDWIVDNPGKSQSRQGSRSGVKSGSVACIDPNYKTYLIEAGGRDGDSGGPVYRETWYEHPTSYRSVGAIHAIGDDTNGGGVHLSEIESYLNVSV